VRQRVHSEKHHREIQGGTARAAVFGVSDGLVSNVSLILGVAGASPGPGVVRLAGLAGLIAGAASMAAGEYVSMKAQQELLGRELEMERRELHRNPEHERVELADIYRSRGVPAGQADELAAAMMRDPDLALETHAREELGIDPNVLGSPVSAAVSSFFSFAAGGVAPRVTGVLGAGVAATIASVVIGVLAAAVVGALIAYFASRAYGRTIVRQIAIAGIAAAVTYAIGSAVGVGASV